MYIDDRKINFVCARNVFDGNLLSLSTGISSKFYLFIIDTSDLRERLVRSLRPRRQRPAKRSVTRLI